MGSEEEQQREGMEERTVLPPDPGGTRIGFPPELALLFSAYGQQLSQLQQEQNNLRAYAQSQAENARQSNENALQRLRQEMEERWRRVDGELEEVRREIREIKDIALKDLEKKIIGNQTSNYKRIIGAQATLIVIIITALVGLFVNAIQH